MGEGSGQLNREAAASLLGWWLESGVDAAVAESPRGWLKPSPILLQGSRVEGDPELDVPSPASPQTAPPASGRGEIDTLDAFHAWLREGSDLPLFQAGAGRALPHGPAEAEIMLVSDLPGRDCAAEGRPIGGEAWQLTERMLKAIGLKPEQAYVASLACFASPANRLAKDELARCGEDMRRHISLVRPKRLLLLGDGPAMALTGEPVLRARGRIHRIEGVPTVATLHPRQLLARPSDKAHAWRDLLLLMSEEVS